MPILQHHDCSHSCLPLPMIHETAPMQDLHYKVDAASKLDVNTTSSYSCDAKNNVAHHHRDPKQILVT